MCQSNLLSFGRLPFAAYGSELRRRRGATGGASNLFCWFDRASSSASNGPNSGSCRGSDLETTRNKNFSQSFINTNNKTVNNKKCFFFLKKSNFSGNHKQWNWFFSSMIDQRWCKENSSKNKAVCLLLFDRWKKTPCSRKSRANKFLFRCFLITNRHWTRCYHRSQYSLHRF